MIVKMSKISIIGMESEKKKLISTLMEMGIVDITDVESKLDDEEWSKLVKSDGSVDKLNEVEADIIKLESAIKYLAPYDNRKKELFQPKIEMDRQKLNKIIQCKSNLMGTVARIDEVDGKLAELRSSESKLHNQIEMLIPWSSMDIPLDECNTKVTSVILGTVPEIIDIEIMKKEFSENLPFSFLEVLSKANERIYLALIYHNFCENETMDILKKYGFTKTQLNDLKGTVSQNIDRINKDIKEINTLREELSLEIAELSSVLADLEVLCDFLSIEFEKEKSYQNLLKTDKTFILEGWLPSELGRKTKENIEHNFNCMVNISEPENGEEHPILLRNNSFVRPFEPITELYSLPSSNGIDPNALFAPFFLVSIGVMMGDAGYGLIMLLISGYFIWRYKLEGTLGKSLKLIFLCGAATVVCGSLFGGWFGDIFDQIMGKKGVIPPLWFNPIEDPMKLLFWSVGFGMVQILFSMGVKGYMLIRDGKVLDAVFDVLLWYILLIGLCLLAIPALSSVGKYMAISGAVLLVLTQGRAKKNIFSKLVSGILSLYNIIGILSDALSYSRLLALGMASGVIASVINTMGTLAGVDNIIGIILLIIVALVGHTFNILSGGLSAFVHGARLQYVEFFSRFYEDGGKAFNPLKINTKYIKIKQEVR